MSDVLFTALVQRVPSGQNKCQSNLHRNDKWNCAPASTVPIQQLLLYVYTTINQIVIFSELVGADYRMEESNSRLFTQRDSIAHITGAEKRKKSDDVTAGIVKRKNSPHENPANAGTPITPSKM